MPTGMIVRTDTHGPGGEEPPLLIDVHAVAALLGCSPRHVWRMADIGKMPRPLAIGALRRWDRARIEAWVHEGCPSCRGR